MKKSVTVYGFHSLRHSFASHCAEAGVPEAVAQSILGAASDIIDKYCVHIGEEAQFKAKNGQPVPRTTHHGAGPGSPSGRAGK
jgi:integrase